MMSQKILIIVGTRPEIIKMAPVYLEFKRDRKVNVVTCLTGQHRDLPKPFLDLFHWKPEYCLQTMVAGQSLNHLSSRLLLGIEEVIQDSKPQMILVHGDTTTTLMGTIAAFHAGIPVGHVEAGLRTHNITSPWPEEMNRKVTDQISSYFFPPTKAAEKNLIDEGILKKQILVTGNTIVDSIVETYNRLQTNETLRAALEEKFKFINFDKKIVFATNHRRENFGKPLENIFYALSDISNDKDCQVICPIHPNPKSKATANKILKGKDNVFRLDPIDYPSSIYLQSVSDLIITDSGGIQEEALILDRPLLVTRGATERPETIDRPTAKLVGTSREKILIEAKKMLKAERRAVKINTKTALGDGRAAARIVKRVLSVLPQRTRPVSIKGRGRTYWVLLPAYNEEGNIGVLLDQLSDLQLENLKVVVVNDGSTDQTLSEIDQNRGNLNLFIFQNPKNLGLGQTFKNGVEHILRNATDSDVLITMDADNSHLPSQIPGMIRMIDANNDVVVASRFIEGAKVQGVPAYRQWLSRCLGWLFRVFYPIEGIKDYSSGFRVYRIKTVKKARSIFGDSKLYFLEGFSCMLGFLIRMSQVSARSAEYPLDLRYDQKQGSSKMKVLETIIASLKILIAARGEPRKYEDQIDDERVSERTKKTGT